MDARISKRFRAFSFLRFTSATLHEILRNCKFAAFHSLINKTTTHEKDFRIANPRIPLCRNFRFLHQNHQPNQQLNSK